MYQFDNEGTLLNQRGLTNPSPLQSITLKLSWWLSQMYYMILGLMFLLSMLVLWRHNKPPVMNCFPKTGLLLILYYTGLAALFFGFSRLHFSLMPWMAMYIGALTTLALGSDAEFKEPDCRQTEPVGKSKAA